MDSAGGPPRAVVFQCQNEVFKLSLWKTDDLGDLVKRFHRKLNHKIRLWYSSKRAGGEGSYNGLLNGGRAPRDCGRCGAAAGRLGLWTSAPGGGSRRAASRARSAAASPGRWVRWAARDPGNCAPSHSARLSPAQLLDPSRHELSRLLRIGTITRAVHSQPSSTIVGRSPRCL